MVKLNNDREYCSLLKKLENAKRVYKSTPEKITGICLELAEYLRNSLLLINESEKRYNEVILWGKEDESCSVDCSLAYRNLAEIAIEKGDFDSAVDKINKSLDFAYTSENPSIIQQSLHQRAHICLSCELPKKHSIEINDQKIDGDSSCRMAQLQNLIAAIYLELHVSDNFHEYDYDKKGLEANEEAMNFATKNNDWALCYRSLLIKLNFTNGKERQQIAESMCAIASKIVPKNADERRFKKESKCHLALEKFRQMDGETLISAKRLLWRCFEDFEKQPDSISADLASDLKNALIFSYKTEQREKKANNLDSKDNSKRRRAQMVLFEKIGDEASKLEFNEIALRYYNKMMKCCDSADDQRKAWISLAETAKDCGLWERCVYFYEQARKWEKELGYDDEKLLETDISIALAFIKVEQISLEERLEKIKKSNNLYSTEKIAKMRRERLSLENSLAEDDEGRKENELIEDSTSNFTDEFDEMNEEQIIFEIRAEMKTIDYEEKIIKARRNMNKHGESSLHEVARSDDYQLLKKLIGEGYDVNQLDHGGWTPLSEAVAASNMANVRLLLMSGANPNTRSTEFLVDSEQNKITSSGLTPLMEACSFGNVSIAKMLLQFKARASSKDDDDWTALEYLRECLKNERFNDSDKEKLHRLAEFIAQRQSEEGFEPRTNSEFLHLLECKRAEKKRTSDSNLNKEQQQNNNLLELSPLKQNSSSNLSNKKRTLSILSDDSDDCLTTTTTFSAAINSSNEESSDEETQNLNDYRKCMKILRNRRDLNEERGGKSNETIVIKRKRLGGNSLRLNSAKKFFK
uniref:ANK_REP_REGION domain-containing protein n=1 Tax=Meloidogyne javanica TaxID=6303 RepID=A0A915LDF6_MELJA